MLERGLLVKREWVFKMGLSLVCFLNSFTFKEEASFREASLYKVCAFNGSWCLKGHPLSNRGGCCKGPLIGLLLNSFSSKEEAPLRKGLPSKKNIWGLVFERGSCFVTGGGCLKRASLWFVFE